LEQCETRDRVWSSARVVRSVCKRDMLKTEGGVNTSTEGCLNRG